MKGISQRNEFGRRLILKSSLGGLAVVVAGGAGGFELVSRGVLPGKATLDRLDGACSVTTPPLNFEPAGPGVSGTFYSAARRRVVGYAIGYPPGCRPGDELPLVVMLHGFAANHANALAGLTPAQAVGLWVSSTARLPPMALVTVDGGNGYWNPHPGDDPLGMVVNELIPRCQRMGLGRAPGRIAVMGISMGGYGALLLAEKHPSLVAAVAAISPAIWTSYDQARAANVGAYASAAAFAAGDVVTHAAALTGRPVRVASGLSDPFAPGVQALAKALPPDAVVNLRKGCHDGSFFISQEPPSLSFLADCLGLLTEGYTPTPQTPRLVQPPAVHPAAPSLASSLRRAETEMVSFRPAVPSIHGSPHPLFAFGPHSLHAFRRVEYR
jgi:enterochelin esterase-like enzyme